MAEQGGSSSRHRKPFSAKRWRKLNPWLILADLGLAAVLVSLEKPDLLSDRNKFLAAFVGVELLSFMGVIVSITIASIANIYLKLGELEHSTGRVFSRTKLALRRSAVSLLWALLAAFFLVTFKGLGFESSRIVALINSAAILIVYFGFSILRDVTRTAMKVPSR